MLNLSTPRIGKRQTVDLGDGRQATLEVVGNGPPMFWFEGGPGLPARLSRPEAELFADSFSVYLIDPHGSGGSTPPADPSLYDHIGHARFYDEVRKALGLHQVSIAGMSFGGTVALTYTSLYPEATVRCIAVSAFAVGTEADDGEAAAEMERMLSPHSGAGWYGHARRVWDEWTEQVLSATDAAQVDDMFHAVFPIYFAHPDPADVTVLIEWAGRELRTDLEALKAWEGGLYQGFDLRPMLATIARPTLVVSAELDPICGPAQARQIVAAVPRAELVIVPDCGHFPAWEAPEQFKAIVLDWCRSH
jgi:2-hydroxy-6-oxonona-2,4-dienedioate hydrolase